MNKSLQVAQRFLSFQKKGEPYPISNLKLQKLLYFAQGHSLGVFGKVLFDEDFIAMSFGPVVFSVYHAYKKYGSRPIDDCSIGCHKNSFEECEEKLLRSVYKRYGFVSANDLVAISHNTAPWLETYDKQKRNIIPLEKIETFFKKEQQKRQKIGFMAHAKETLSMNLELMKALA